MEKPKAEFWDEMHRATQHLRGRAFTLPEPLLYLLSFLFNHLCFAGPLPPHTQNHARLNHLAVVSMCSHDAQLLSIGLNEVFSASD